MTDCRGTGASWLSRIESLVHCEFTRGLRWPSRASAHSSDARKGCASCSADARAACSPAFLTPDLDADVPCPGMQAKSAGGGVTCLTSGPRPALVSGSREGVITSWAVDSGIAMQTIDITQVQPSALQKRLPAKGI